ncbi:sensor histidine kinase [Edaphosphingomonas haloaromaticamans]|uniref:histidine kinase n=1 Tax=Edaphosphingomonas haloaromaticamans TaxID=653954 RepID=A0A1S1HBZ8_9SPHN|nr:MULTISPECIES: HAMP domain-containing sensor histidine kinase [Sphingomonas]MDX3885497.1 HAMP domain-containing sensor histidine kinase [Sphingomonas sp.]OHT19704.1 Sensor protein RstB [Sphingomonas haloaromaticamans]
MRPRNFLRSSTIRFVALVFALQIGSSVLLLLAVQHIAAGELRQLSVDIADELRGDLAASFDEGGLPALKARAQARIARSPGDDVVVLVADGGGRELAGNLGAWPPGVKPDGEWRAITLYRVDSDRPERMIVSASRMADGSLLLAGHVVEGSLQLRATVEEAMASVLLLALPIALLGAMLAARVVDGRIARIATTVQAVRTGDLSRRIPLDGSGDAFETLAAGINAMLDRIETLVTELRIVTDGLAHDLRSPLTRLKAGLERAIAETGDDMQATALQSVANEAETLLAMLGTALQISRAEAGIGRDRFTDVDVAAMLSDIAEVYGPVAEDHGFRLEWDAQGDMAIRAHRELLGQALANLVDNAMKYARPGPIRLRARRTPDGIAIGVADSGPGIPPEHRAEALRRFGRLDPARHIGGAGLGLSLVSAVARLHGGEIRLESDPDGLAGGFEVEIRLPG